MPGTHDGTAELSAEEITRYSRHLTLPDVGLAGQKRLRSASVLLVGAGGLGSPAAVYLAAVGVGRIGLVDFDTIDLSNLQRQVLYDTADVGRPKLDPARERILRLNPHVDVRCHPLRIDASNARSILEGYDIVVDGTDNFPARYLVNDACVLLGKPNVYGSIFRFEGQVSVFWAGHGPCYRCLYPEPPAAGAVPNCAEGGVLGVLPGVIGCIQATEAIKLILGLGQTLLGRLLLFDAREMQFRELKLRRDPDCPICGVQPRIRELRDVEQTCNVSTPSAPPQNAAHETSARSLSAEIESGARPLLLDVRTPEEWQICHIDGATLLPLQELETRVGELDPRQEIVVYCHVGGRSALAVGFLLERGFKQVRNLIGGIDSWAVEVDPALPRY